MPVTSAVLAPVVVTVLLVEVDRLAETLAEVHSRLPARHLGHARVIDVYRADVDPRAHGEGSPHASQLIQPSRCELLDPMLSRCGGSPRPPTPPLPLPH